MSHVFPATKFPESHLSQYYFILGMAYFVRNIEKYPLFDSRRIFKAQEPD